MHSFLSKNMQSYLSFSLTDDRDVPIMLPKNAKISCNIIITKIHLFVKISSLENFIFAYELFYITFVSCPVKTATP
jgi:hypothetical protein